MKYSTTKEIEEVIRRAFEIDHLLPPVFANKTRGSTLGSVVDIPDTLRSLDDLAEDPRLQYATAEDLEIWNMVMFNWLPCVSLLEREIIRCRCRNMGWKRIARHLCQRKFADRELYRTTLWRTFQDGLKTILTKN